MSDTAGPTCGTARRWRSRMSTAGCSAPLSRLRPLFVFGCALLSLAIPGVPAPGFDAGPVAAAQTPPRTSPTEVTRSAAQALYDQYYEPLDAAQLFGEAWAGATGALRAAEIEAIPPA